MHLLLQSPVELTPELRDAINALGTLKHIVSPNYEHVKFAKQVRSVVVRCHLLYSILSECLLALCFDP